jgi:hypothetical protein
MDRRRLVLEVEEWLNGKEELSKTTLGGLAVAGML